MIRVLIVDDSAVVRKVLAEELSKYDDIDVVGSATDPYAAREIIARLHPDVITLDLEMPRMDGLSFLARLMKHHPLPVVIVSSLAPQNSETALKALQLGAVDVICKPGSQYSVPDVHKQLARAIRAAAEARVGRLQGQLSAQNGLGAMTQLSRPLLPAARRIIAIGASTGGTQAVEIVLRGMPADAPGAVVVQHMPEVFTASFAKRLDGICEMEVREARDGDSVVPGSVLVAPGNHHMLLHQSGDSYRVRIRDGPPVHHQRPSADVLFNSVALSAGPDAVGVILTGMGADGAKGLVAMRERGSHTIAQDEKSCIVFGMPKEAIRLGAAAEIAPLHRISEAILRAVSQSEAGSVPRRVWTPRPGVLDGR